MPTHISVRLEPASSAPVAVESSAPTMNPNWTTMVSVEVPPELKSTATLAVVSRMSPRTIRSSKERRSAITATATAGRSSLGEGQMMMLVTGPTRRTGPLVIDKCNI